jgi:hypothetical protein
MKTNTAEGPGDQTGTAFPLTILSSPEGEIIKLTPKDSDENDNGKL